MGTIVIQSQGDIHHLSQGDLSVAALHLQLIWSLLCESHQEALLSTNQRIPVQAITENGPTLRQSEKRF